ncbi:MAG: carbohydrate ABC transporter permease [Spirochaetes bacterium]|nr:MAG: carbohydrate ABC transporter permease [Spirochaetota bacterium]
MIFYSAERFYRKIVYLLLFFFTIFFLFPILWMFIISLKPVSQLYRFPPHIIPRPPVLKNYVYSFINIGIGRNLFNSLILTLGTLAVSIPVSIPAAYALSKFRFRFQSVLLLGILGTQMIPGMASLVPLFDILKSFKLLDSFIGLIFIYTARTLPLNIWIFKGFFDTIPNDLFEAALVDGCTQFQSMRYIMVPLVLPGMAAASMFTIMQSWIEFIVPLTMLFSEEKLPFPVAVYKFMGSPIMGTNYGAIFASAAVGSLPILMLFIIFQRYFIKGLTAGAVKE